jgi:hypothetical protein
MTIVEAQDIEHEQGIVQPGEPIAQEPPEPQLPVTQANRLYDRVKSIEVGWGGIQFRSFEQVLDLALAMSLSGQAVPAHCRDNKGMCLAIALNALEWRMSPWAVANQTYVTNDRLNYQSQLQHAVLEARGPFKHRMKVRYEGEGEDTVCIVWTTFLGEDKPTEHRSPPLGKLRPPRNDKGIVKGSPLWDRKPLVQMFYDTSRDFGRIHCPDVLLGIYSPEEIAEYSEGTAPGDRAQDITAEADAAAALHERLAATPQNGEGFREGVVEAGLASTAENPDQPGESVAYSAGMAGQATPTAAKPKKRATGHRTADARVSERLAEVNKPKTARPTRPAGQKRAPSAAGQAAKTAPATASEKTGPALRTPADYEWHMRGWLAVHEDPDEIETRWKNEWKMRKSCNCAGGDAATALLQIKNARIKELQS